MFPRDGLLVIQIKALTSQSALCKCHKALRKKVGGRLEETTGRWKKMHAVELEDDSVHIFVLSSSTSPPLPSMLGHSQGWNPFEGTQPVKTDESSGRFWVPGKLALATAWPKLSASTPPPRAFLYHQVNLPFFFFSLGF